MGVCRQAEEGAGAFASGGGAEGSTAAWAAKPPRRAPNGGVQCQPLPDRCLAHLVRVPRLTRAGAWPWCLAGKLCSTCREISAGCQKKCTHGVSAVDHEVAPPNTTDGCCRRLVSCTPLTAPSSPASSSRAVSLDIIVVLGEQPTQWVGWLQGIGGDEGRSAAKPTDCLLFAVSCRWAVCGSVRQAG